MEALHSRRTYDYRIQEAICESGDRELFPELNIPRSTIRSWIHRGTTEVVTCEFAAHDYAERVVEIEGDRKFSVRSGSRSKYGHGPLGPAESDDQLRMLRSFLGSSWFPQQKKWLIDNRVLEQRPSLDQIMRLLDITTQFHAKIDDIVVAWVAKGPCVVTMDLLEEVLPFHFERFEDIEEAHDWLMSQDVFDPASRDTSSTRYRDERLGAEIGFTRRPVVPQVHTEADADLMLATSWAIAHDGEDAPHALGERARTALAARVEEALAEVEED